MNRKFWIIIAAVAAGSFLGALTAVSLQKTRGGGAAPADPPPSDVRTPFSPGPASPQPAMPGGPPPGSLAGAKIVVPDSVKGKWKGVVFLVEDKKESTFTEYTVNLGRNWKVPGTDLSVAVGEFLPDLVIQENSFFTSVSGELKNPAIYVRVREGKKEIFKGWLFSLFPTIHPFQHERYAITLKDAVKA